MGQETKRQRRIKKVAEKELTKYRKEQTDILEE